MKLQLKVLLNSVNALKTLGDDKSLNVKTKYTIARNIRLIQQELDNFEKARVELIQKYGEKDDKGNTTVLPEKINKFTDEFAELQTVEVDLDIRKVGADACVNLSANEMFLLDWLLSDEPMGETP